MIRSLLRSIPPKRPFGQRLDGSGLRIRRRITTLGLILFFGFYLFVGFSQGEAFPFSTFPMYSVARLDPYVVPSQRIFAYTEDGDEYRIQSQSIRGRVRALRRDIVLDNVSEESVAGLVDELLRRINIANLTPDPAVGLRVIDLELQLRAIGEGDPLKPKVVSSALIIDETPPDADVSAAATPTDVGETNP